MKQCPCCGSGKVKEGKTNGVWYLVCYSCGYDSSERDRKNYEREHKARREKERAR